MKANIEKDAIPDGWQRVRLGDVAEVNRSNWDPSDGSSILYLDLTAVSAPGILSSARLVQAADAPSRARRRVASDDILVSTVRPNLRGFARVREASDNLVASTGFAIVTPLEKVDGSFAYHHVMTSQFADHLVGATTGQAYPAVRPIDVEAYQLLLPPLPEQRAIAAVLDSINDTIEGAEAVIAATEHLRDALLHDLLTRGLPGQHTEFRDVPGLGTIPADWEVVRLGDVLDSTTYGTNSPLSAVGDIPVLRMNNLQKGQINLTDVRRANLNDKETRELDLACGDILFNRTNSLDLVGKVAVVRNLPKPMSFASYLVRLRVKKERANPFWLSALLWSDGCQARIRKYATPGVSQANINPTSLKTLTVSLPPLAEQRDIAASLDGVYSAIQVAREELGRLRLLSPNPPMDGLGDSP